MADHNEKPEPVHAPTIRSRVVLEIAAELVAANQPRHQAKVMLRDHGEDWPICLSGASTIDAIDDVVSGRATMAFTNPSTVLTLAHRGQSPFKSPQPVRAIAVVPSLDQYMFAVKSDTGLVNFEDIGKRRYPLRMAGRTQRDHLLHLVRDHAAEASGFSMADVESCGGEFHYTLTSRGDRLALVKSGKVDALFDEAVHNWIDDALDNGMTILSFTEPTLRKLEAIGYRRGVLRKSDYPKLPGDITTIDFSGWAMFVHADAPDKLVTQICAGLDARKHLIPWQGDGPLPVERMCRDEEDAPLGVPLHPAAEKFWRQKGYIS
jgi:hypothetical protein